MSDTLARRIVLFIGDYKARHGYPPAFRDLIKGLDIKNYGLLEGYIGALRDLGYVTYQTGHARTLRALKCPRR